jgi:gliding motility-associated-like protein
MKRLITLLVIGFTVITTGAFSQTVTFSISPSSVSINQGQQVCLDVEVSNFTDMVSMQFSINYDQNVLDFDEATNLNLPGLNGSSIGNPSPGNITVSWLADDIIGGETVAGGTAIFQLCFTGLTDGTSDIEFSGNPTSIEVTNVDGLVTMNGVDGEVIVGSGGGGNQDGLVITAPDVSVGSGNQVCIDITVENFVDLVSMQFSINYDQNILDFDEATNLNLPGLNGSSIGNPSPGNITVSWLADDVIAGETVSDGTAIFSLCFTGASSGTSDIAFSGSPTSVEVTDVNGLVDLIGNNGSITVTGGPPASGLVINAPNVNADSGDEVCVDITVENFVDLVSMQFSINYDPSILTFDEATNLNLAGLNGSSIGNPSPGNITVSWLADDVIAGETVANGTAIFTLCFTAVGGGTSPIDFSGSPTSIEVTDVSGLVDLIENDGSVTVSGGPVSTEFQLIAPMITAEPGEEICIDITTQNFIDLVSMQFSINYDDAVLEYTGADNFNLPGLNGSGVGNPTPGNITVSWLADDVIAGQDMPNGSTLFSLCFTVISGGGTMSPITFSGSPTSIEITDVDGLVDLDEVNGKVTVEGDLPPGFALLLSDEQVMSGQNVCLDVSVQDFSSIVSMQFSINYDPAMLTYTGSDNLNLSGLTASNIGNPGGPSSGNITVSWLADDPVLGVTLPDGDVIFQVCFDAIGPNCNDTNVSFSSNPTPIEVTDADGLVTFNSASGTVSICDVFPEVTLAVEQETGAAGQTVCVGVTAMDFVNIVSMQFSMTYDPAIVEFASVGGFNLSGLDGSSFGVPPMTSLGEITMSWLADDPLTGETVADGTQLFEVCFNVIGTFGEVSPIQFSSDPTSIEITDTDGEIDLNGNNGSVTVDDCPALGVSPTVKAACFGLDDGCITLNPIGGDGSYVYQWDIPGASGDEVCDLSPDTYNVTVTSCGFSQGFPITVGETTPVSITEIINDVDCFGDDDGSIFLNLGGDDPFTFIWEGAVALPNPNNQNQAGLAPGNYRVTVTDDNGCEYASDNFMVEGPSEALIADIANVSDVDCFGEGNGIISLSVDGGTPGYDFNWSPSLPNQATHNNLDGGLYSVTVTDDNNCTIELTSIEVEEPDVLAASVDNIDDESTAGNDGSISISVNGGTGNYEFSWSGPGGPYDTEDLAGLTQGTYNLTITDENDCETTLTAVVEKPLEITLLEMIPACFEENNGSITVDVAGGVEPYSFFWQGPGGPYFTQNLTNVPGGNYQLTVTDANNEQTILQVIVDEPSAALEVVDVTTQDPSAQFASDGLISIVNVDGGTPPYNYAWSNNQTGATITNLISGTYCVTITDSGNCELTTCYELLFIPPPLVTDLNNQQNVDCNGNNTGSWNIAIEGGISPYTFAFSDDIDLVSNDGEVTRNNLLAGVYTVTITDNFTPPQEVIETITITEPDPLELTNVLIYPETGFGNDGEIDVTIDGGMLLYDYEWDNGEDIQDIENLDEGCYQLTVVDANGCIFVTDEICVPKLEVDDFDVVENFCKSDEDGEIVIQVAGDLNQPLEYQWFGPDGQPIQLTGTDLDGLASGTYTVVITDALGVTTPPFEITVGFESDVTVTGQAVSDYNGYDVSCPDSEDGAVVASASDGQLPYSYLWLELGEVTQSVNDVPGGQYTIQVTDAFGCQDTAIVDVIAPDQIEVFADAVSPDCFGLDNGMIELSVDGGTPNYRFAWDDALKQQTNPAILLPAGTYTVTITDENDCMHLENYTLEEPDSLRLKLEITPDNGNGNGAAEVSVQGGAFPYFFLWQNGARDSIVRNLTAGEYVISVEDVNGCTASAVAIIPNDAVDCLEYRNVISPNGDGMNEEFRLNCLEDFPDHVLEIYNRWGQLVYKTTSFANDWEGVDETGQPVPEGAYFFIFEYKDSDGSTQQQRGHISIIRE